MWNLSDIDSFIHKEIVVSDQSFIDHLEIYSVFRIRECLSNSFVKFTRVSMNAE